MPTIQIDVEANKQRLRQFGNDIRQTINKTTVRDPFTQSILSSSTTIRRNIQAIVPVAERLGQQFGRTAERFGVFVVAAKSINSFINAARQGVGAAISFDRELVRLNQLGQTTQGQIAAVAKEINRLSTSFGVSSAELAAASVTLRQAGFNIDDTRIALQALADVSLAPTFDSMAQATEGGIAAIQQFKLEAKDLQSIFGSINAVSARFAVESDDLVSAIQRAGGAFSVSSSSSGLKGLNELLALFTSVRQTTRESADQIATGLRTIFTRIQRQDTVEQLRALGVELRDARGQFVGAFEAFRRLSEGLNDIPTTDPRFSQAIEALGGYRQVSRVIPLIRQFSVAQEALNTAQSGGASLMESTQKAQASYAVQIQKLTESFNQLFRSLSQNDLLKQFLTLTLQTTTAVVKLADSLSPLLVALGLIGGVKLLSAVPKFVGALGKGFASGGRVEKANAMVMPGELIVPPNKVSSAELVQANSTGKVSDRVRKRILENAARVPGSGNSDSVPAFLPAGTFVIKKRSSQKIEGFASGGRKEDDDEILERLRSQRNRLIQIRSEQPTNTFQGMSARQDAANDIANLEKDIQKEIDRISKSVQKIEQAAPTPLQQALAASDSPPPRPRPPKQLPQRSFTESPPPSSITRPSGGRNRPSGSIVRPLSDAARQAENAARNASKRNKAPVELTKQTQKTINSLVKQQNIPAAAQVYGQANPDAQTEQDFLRLLLAGQIPGVSGARNEALLMGGRDARAIPPPRQGLIRPKTSNRDAAVASKRFKRGELRRPATRQRNAEADFINQFSADIASSIPPRPPADAIQDAPEFISSFRRREQISRPRPSVAQPSPEQNEAAFLERERRFNEVQAKRRVRADFRANTSFLDDNGPRLGRRQLNPLNKRMKGYVPDAANSIEEGLDAFADLGTKASKAGKAGNILKGLFGKLSAGGVIAGGVLATAQNFLPENIQQGSVGQGLNIAGGALAGAGVGAQLGSFAGPWGVAAGGILGGIAGGLGSLFGIMSSSEAKNFEQTASRVSTGMGALGAISGKVSVAQINEFNKLSSDFSQGIQGLSGEKRTSRIQQSFNTDAAASFINNYARNSVLPGLVESGDVSFGKGDAVEEVDKAALAVSKTLREKFGQQLTLIAEASNKSLSELTAEFSKTAAEQARATTIQQRQRENNQKLQQAVTGQVQLYRELAGSLARSIASTEKFSASLTDIEGLSTGSPRLRSTESFTRAAQTFGSGNGLLSPLTNQLKNFDTAGIGLGTEAEFFDRLNKVLPEVLSRVSLTQSENPQVQITESLQKEFGGQFQQFGSIFNRITDQINGFDLAEFQNKLAEAPGQLAEELTRNAGGDQIQKILSDVAQSFETAVNQFADGLNRNAQIIQQVNESYAQQDRVVSATNEIFAQTRQSNRAFGTREENSNISGRRGLQQTTGDRFRNIIGRTGMLLDSDVRGEFVRQEQNTIDSQRRFFTGEFAPNIQASEAFNSDTSQKAFQDRLNRLLPGLGAPTAANVSARLSSAQGDVRARQEQLQRAQDGGASIEEINQIQQGISQAQTAAQNAASALNELADVTTRTADIQKELADIEQARTAQNDVAEQLLRGGRGAARKLQGDLQATQFFASRGQATDFAGTPVLNRVLDFLEKNQSLRLQNGQGQFITGGDLRNQLISQAAGTFGRTGLAPGVFGGNLDERRLQLTNNLDNAGKEAVAAQQSLTTNQENLQGQFFNTLQQQNKTFLDELKRTITEGQIKRQDVAVSDAQGRLNEITSLQKDAQSLTTAVGTQTVEQATNSILNPAVQSVLQQDAKSSAVNTQFDDIVNKINSFQGPITPQNIKAVTGLDLNTRPAGYNVVDPNNQIRKSNLISLVNQERNRELIKAGASDQDPNAGFKRTFFTAQGGLGVQVRTPLTSEQQRMLEQNRENNTNQTKAAAGVLGFDPKELRGQGEELTKQAERLRGKTSAQLVQDQSRLQEQIKVGQNERQKLQQQLPQAQVDRALPNALDGFNKNAQPVAGAMDKLANSLEKAQIPEKIVVDMNSNVNVILNGAEIMNKLVESLRQEVINTVAEQIKSLNAQQTKGPNGEVQGIPQV